MLSSQTHQMTILIEKSDERCRAYSTTNFPHLTPEVTAHHISVWQFDYVNVEEFHGSCMTKFGFLIQKCTHAHTHSKSKGKQT